MPISDPQARFKGKLFELSRNYASVQAVRPDGNCFYRAYLYGLLANCLDSEAALSVLRNKFRAIADECKLQGYDAFAIDEFHELVDEEIQHLQNNRSLRTLSDRTFKDNSVDGYLVTFLRCACGAALKKWSNDYIGFLPSEYASIDEFCRKEVDPIYRDCDQVQIVGLTRIIGVPVNIMYLEQSESVETVVQHIIGDHVDDMKLVPGPVNLLYRPGHYDVLNKV